MKANISKQLSYLRPDLTLQIEALFVFVLALVVYRQALHGSWGLFALLFLVPDISILAFALPSKPLAAGLYNLLHTYAIPLAVALVSWKTNLLRGEQIALIWLAHISLDRTLGFGLKFPQSFRFTHIQRSASIGDANEAAARGLRW